MKKITSLITQLLIIIMLFLIIFSPKTYFSPNENRFLEKFPMFSLNNILNGSFMSRMSSYIADHFPYREKFLNLKTNILKISGQTRQNGVYYGKDGYLIEEYKKPVNAEKIIRVVNRFIENNPNIQYDFMLVPTSSYILNDKLPQYNLNYDEKEVIKEYKKNLKANFIDIENELLEQKNNEIYYKTDHHWTTRGAYIAYQKYCLNKGLNANNYQFIKVTDSFYGTLYSKIIDDSIKQDYIEKIIDNNIYQVNYQNQTKYTLYDDKYLNEKDKYSYFLSGNQSIITINNSNIQDKELLIIKDSYANSFIPMIVPHYSKIHIIDPRYYKKKISDYIKENNIKNILFLYNIGTIDDDLGILSIN